MSSGRGAVRLARLLWEQEVEGSNPFAPTELKTHLMKLHFRDCVFFV